MTLKRTIHRTLVRSALSFTLVFQFGCDALKSPYALSTSGIDESGRQTAAAILIADPQVYSRETLINDRRREQELIRTLLEDSPKAKFQPQIVRDLLVYQSVQSELGAAFDPTAGLQTRDANRINEIRQNTAELQEQLKLAQALKNLQEFQASPATTPPQDPASPLPQPSSEQAAQKLEEELEAQRTELRNLKARVESLLKQNPGGSAEEGLASRKARSSGVESTPQEYFRDLQAYRSDLRAALAAAELDDLHDHGGNALYKLQFKTTILPGRRKDKFAVTALELTPPKLTEDVVSDVYWNWLAHSTLRLNKTRSFGSQGRHSGLEADLQYDGFARNSQLIDVVEIKYVPQEKGKPSGAWLCETRPERCTVRIAVPHPLGGEISKRHRSFASQTLSKAPTFTYGPLSDECLATVFATSARALLTNASLPESIRSSIYKAIVELRGNDTSICPVALSAMVPTVFKDLLKKISPDATGTAFAYSTGPSELAQRVSTTSGAANSFQSALAVSAMLPQYGANLDASHKYLRGASAAAEARERVPLVVGFAERGGPSSLPVFGWIFGPSAQLNPRGSKLELAHVVRSYDVSADLSVPGWWPTLNLKWKAAWVSNWHGGEPLERTGNAWRDFVFDSADAVKLMFGGQTARRIRHGSFVVPLPLTRGDLDSLTEELIRVSGGGRTLRSASISKVEPETFSICAKSVDLLIHGRNVWRSSEVYLAAVEASQIWVLPNMEGIRARFDIDEIRTITDWDGWLVRSLPLTVVTRHGTDRFEVHVEGALRGNRCVARSEFPAANIHNQYVPRISQISPTEIPGCTSEVDLFIAGTNLSFPKETARGVETPPAFAFSPGLQIGVVPHEWTNHLSLKTASGKTFRDGPNPIEITYRTADGFARFSVPVSRCGRQFVAKGGPYRSLSRRIVGGASTVLRLRSTSGTLSQLAEGLSIRPGGPIAERFSWVDGTSFRVGESQFEDTFLLKGEWNVRNGTQLRIAVRERAGASSPATYHEILDPVIYYQSQANSEVLLHTTEISDASEPLRITLPARMDQAFNIGPSGLRLVAKAKVPFEISPAEVSNPGEERTLEIQLVPSTKAMEELSRAGRGPISVELSLETDLQYEIPGLSQDKITIKAP